MAIFESDGNPLTGTIDGNKLEAAGLSPNLNSDLDKTPEIQLVGVLAGDVDGSWAG